MILFQDAVIANGQSQSTPIDLTDMQIVSVLMPAAWTAADLTLLGSADGATWVPVHDQAGVEVTLDAAASRLIMLGPDALKGLRFVKLRSGTTAAVVNQGAARTVKVGVASTA